MRTHIVQNTVLAAVFTAALILPGSAFAQQGAGSNGLRQGLRQEGKELKEEIVQNRQEVRAHVAEVHANRLQKRFDAYYKRLSKMITKFRARLEVMKTNGKDVTAATAKVDEAAAKLEEAKKLADKSIQAFRDIDPDKYAEQRELALQARDIAMEARTAFKEVLTLLKSSLPLLKK